MGGGEKTTTALPLLCVTAPGGAGKLWKFQLFANFIFMIATAPNKDLSAHRPTTDARRCLAVNKQKTRFRAQTGDDERAHVRARLPLWHTPIGAHACSGKNGKQVRETQKVK